MRTYPETTGDPRTHVQELLQMARRRDPHAAAHNKRVGIYSRMMARLLGFTVADAEHIEEAAITHDIGKLGLPANILQKPGPLTLAEWTVMRRHTKIGASLLRWGTAYDIALTHHERWDGTGYPLGLMGTQIPVSARIVTLGDQYDAMRSERPYKPAWSHKEACRIILEGDTRTRPDHFDPQILKIFREHHQDFDTTYERNS